MWGAHFFRVYLRLNRSYKCKDSFNNLMPVGAHNGVSAATAADASTAVTATVGFKYTGVVGKGDECAVAACAIYVDSASNTKSASCAQTAGAGTQKSYSAAFSVRAGAHTYWTTLTSKGLADCARRCTDD